MAGAATAFLPEQARALPQISDAYNKVIYENKLTHAPTTAMELRPIAQAVRRFNHIHFSAKSNVVYISVIDSQAQTVGTGSVYNDNNCRLVLNLVEDLIKEIKEGNIAILGCYQAQYRCYSSGLAKMAKEIEGVSDRVLTDKIDRRQGSEFDIVIVDLTRTEGVGFLKDRRRLNVLLSRAKHGLYVVGNKRHVTMQRVERKVMEKVPSSQTSPTRLTESSTPTKKVGHHIYLI
jgi:superfamily I DNA and/or RNA helicase